MTAGIGRSRHVTDWSTFRLVRGRILDLVPQFGVDDQQMLDDPLNVSSFLVHSR